MSGTGSLGAHGTGGSSLVREHDRGPGHLVEPYLEVNPGRLKLILSWRCGGRGGEAEVWRGDRAKCVLLFEPLDGN